MTEPTRKHREAALAAWNGPNPPRVVLAVNATIKPWIEMGEPIRDGGPMGNLTQALQRIAQAIADVEERMREAGVFAGRALERADVVAECERVERMGSPSSPETDAIRRLRMCLQRGNHVGKAEGTRDA